MVKKTDHDLELIKIRNNAFDELVEHYKELKADGLELGFLNIRGYEVPDPTPTDPPIGHIAGPDLIEQVRAMVRTELSRRAEEEGFETFEEADDFEVDDDEADYVSPYEMFFNPAPGEPDGPPSPATEGVKGEAAPPSADPAPPSAPPAKPSTPVPPKEPD